MACVQNFNKQKRPLATLTIPYLYTKCQARALQYILSDMKWVCPPLSLLPYYKVSYVLRKSYFELEFLHTEKCTYLLYMMVFYIILRTFRVKKVYVDSMSLSSTTGVSLLEVQK